MIGGGGPKFAPQPGPPGGENRPPRAYSGRMPSRTDIATRAEELLHELTGPDAVFREHQLEAIRDLVDDRARVLCVQRTGWGKSAVYFLSLIHI